MELYANMNDYKVHHNVIVFNQHSLYPLTDVTKKFTDHIFYKILLEVYPTSAAWNIALYHFSFARLHFKD